MKRNEKEEIIDRIKELVKDSSAMFLVNYSGVNVADINKLRSEFRKDGVTYKVFKNTLFKKAIEQSGGYEKLNEQLVGMIGVAFAGENFVAPAKIIKKYEKTQFLRLPNHVLPTLANAAINWNLKIIAHKCGITKPLSFHIARHTFATTVTLTNGVPIETVSKMLGHTSIKTTQIYAKVVDSKISNDMQILRQKLETQIVSEKLAKTGN